MLSIRNFFLLYLLSIDEAFANAPFFDNFDLDTPFFNFLLQLIPTGTRIIYVSSDNLSQAEHFVVVFAIILNLSARFGIQLIILEYDIPAFS